MSAEFKTVKHPVKLPLKLVASSCYIQALFFQFLNGERIKLLPSLCIFASIVTWGISISFFVQGLTNWQVRESFLIIIILAQTESHAT